MENNINQKKPLSTKQQKNIEFKILNNNFGGYIKQVVPPLKYIMKNKSNYEILNRLIQKFYNGKNEAKAKIIGKALWSFGDGYDSKLKKITKKILDVTNLNAKKIASKQRTIAITNLYNISAGLNQLYNKLNINRIAQRIDKREMGVKYNRFNTNSGIIKSNLNIKRYKKTPRERRLERIQNSKIPITKNIIYPPIPEPRPPRTIFRVVPL